MSVGVLTMTAKNIDFTTVVDDGSDTADAIQPIGAEAATPTAANRPHENLRVRTESLRVSSNAESIMRARYNNWILDTGSGGTLITYGDTYGGGAPAGNEGRIVIGNGTTDTIFLSSFISAGAPRGASYGDASTPYENLYPWENFTSAGTSFDVIGKKLLSNGNHWTSLTVVSSPQLEALVSVEVKGSPPSTPLEPFTPGRKEIVVTISGAAPFHSVDDIRVAIAAEPIAASLVAVVVNTAGTAFDIAKTRLRQGLETVMFSVSGSVMASFFTATNDNLLRNGDTLALYFADEQTLFTKVTAGGGMPALLSSNIKNLSRYIDDSLGTGLVIPICKAFNNKVVFINGTTISSTTPGKLSLHASSILANALTGRVVTGVSPSIQDDLDSIALAFNDLTDASVSKGLAAPLHLVTTGVPIATLQFRNTDVILPADEDFGSIEGVSVHGTANYAGVRAKISLRTESLAGPGNQGAGAVVIDIAPANSTTKATMLSVDTTQTIINSGLLRIPKCQPKGDIDFTVEGAAYSTVVGDETNVADVSAEYSTHRLETFSAGGGLVPGIHARSVYTLINGNPDIRYSVRVKNQDTAGNVNSVHESLAVQNSQVGINMRGNALSQARLTIRNVAAVANAVIRSVEHICDLDGVGGADGLGVSETFQLANDLGNNVPAGEIGVLWTDSGNGTESAKMDIDLSRAGNGFTAGPALTITDVGTIHLNMNNVYSPLTGYSQKIETLATNQKVLARELQLKTSLTAAAEFGLAEHFFLDDSAGISNRVTEVEHAWETNPTGAGAGVMRLFSFNQGSTTRNPVEITPLGEVRGVNLPVAWANIGIDGATPADPPANFSYASNPSWSGTFDLTGTYEIIILFGAFTMADTSYLVEFQTYDPVPINAHASFTLNVSSKTVNGFSVFCRNIIAGAYDFMSFSFKVTGKRA